MRDRHLKNHQLLLRRELLTNTQREVRRMKEEYEETVPQREYDRLQAERLQDERSLREHVDELLALKDRYEKVAGTLLVCVFRLHFYFVYFSQRGAQAQRRS